MADFGRLTAGRPGGVHGDDPLPGPLCKQRLPIIRDDRQSLFAKGTRERCLRHCPVPNIDGVVAGFSCKSASRQNNQRKPSAISEGAPCSTASTFIGCMHLLAAKAPKFLLFENVDSLSDDPGTAEFVHVRHSFGLLSWGGLIAQALDCASLPPPPRLHPPPPHLPATLQRGRCQVSNTDAVASQLHAEGYDVRIFRMDRARGQTAVLFDGSLAHWLSPRPQVHCNILVVALDAASRHDASHTQCRLAASWPHGLATACPHDRVTS